MAAKKAGDYRSYWETNIDRWGDYYLEISHGHEVLNGPAWLASLYRWTIGPIERRLMAERYARTIAFLDRYAKPETIVSDLGCGTGIFVVEALRRGAKVNAIDFTQAAIDTTRANVARHSPQGEVSFLVADVTTDPLPRSDVSLAMGITPYIRALDAFLGNVLPSTRVLCCLYVDPQRWQNRLRIQVPQLNVRDLQFHDRADVDRQYARFGWRLVERRDFATGYIDLAEAGSGS
jgi:SAM-dependent methyltransferase